MGPRHGRRVGRKHRVHQGLTWKVGFPFAVSICSRVDWKLY